MYHSTLGLRVIKKKTKKAGQDLNHLGLLELWEIVDLVSRRCGGGCERERVSQRVRARESERESERARERVRERERESERESARKSERVREREREREEMRRGPVGVEVIGVGEDVLSPPRHRWRAEHLQGYLAHKKTHLPRTLL